MQKVYNVAKYPFESTSYTIYLFIKSRCCGVTAPLKPVIKWKCMGYAGSPYGHQGVSSWAKE